MKVVKGFVPGSFVIGRGRKKGEGCEAVKGFVPYPFVKDIELTMLPTDSLVFVRQIITSNDLSTQMKTEFGLVVH